MRILETPGDQTVLNCTLLSFLLRFFIYRMAIIEKGGLSLGIR